MTDLTTGSVTLTASDGVEISAYRAALRDQAIGAVVVIQEVFGVNDHIRSVADGFAAAGFVALAPAFFNRIGRSDELGYGAEDIDAGLALAYGIAWEDALKDVGAAVRAARSDDANGSGTVGVVGYCWGGTLSWLSATRLTGMELPDAVASYYGSKVPNFANEAPQCPIIMHLGEQDPTMPPEAVATIRAANPAMPTYLYAGADHGFNCNQRASYHAEAAKTAFDRTTAFFREKLV